MLTPVFGIGTADVSAPVNTICCATIGIADTKPTANAATASCFFMRENP